MLIDTRKLQKVRKALRTRSIRDTVDRALDEALALEARRRLLDRLSRTNGRDLANAKVIAAAWRKPMPAPSWAAEDASH